MKAVNFIIDTLYDILEYILMLLIVGIAVLVILWRLEVLFNEQLPIVSKTSSAIESTLGIEKSATLNSSLIGEKIKVNISEGTSLEGITKILFDYELISDKFVFLKLLNDNFTEENKPFGEFQFTYGQSNEDIINILKK